MDEGLQKQRKACRISADALAYGASLMKKGVRMIEVCDAVDEKMRTLGAQPAFPAQISIDHVAAHYCCPANDETLLSGVCKIDVGAHIDGYGGDNAMTVDLSGNNAKLVQASVDALAAAVNAVRDGVTLGMIGSIIQEEVVSGGFAPVRNLSGHGVGRFELHAKPSVPNYGNNDSTPLRSGQVIAIEPFVTTGEGVILEAGVAEVFMQIAKNPVRDATARQILADITAYQNMPFAKRWLEATYGPMKTNIAFRQLVQAGNLKGFPPLIERGRGMVSQAEHTILVTESGHEVLTKAED
jgi:methionyl aminopeptidase